MRLWIRHWQEKPNWLRLYSEPRDPQLKNMRKSNRIEKTSETDGQPSLSAR